MPQLFNHGCAFYRFYLSSSLRIDMSEKQTGFTFNERRRGRKRGSSNPNGGRRKRHVRGQSTLKFNAGETASSNNDDNQIADNEVCRYSLTTDTCVHM